MIFIFDLDDTLIDNVKLKSNLAKILQMSLKDFKASRLKYFSRESDLYCPIRHVEFLCCNREVTEQQKQKYINKIENMAKEIRNFLFPEVKSILNQLKKEKNYLILLTHGDLTWQKLKVKSLPIKKYFNKIIITDKDKADVLNFLKEEEKKIVFINDNAKENINIRKKLPNIKTLLIRGPHADNVEHKQKIHKLKHIINQYGTKKEKN